MLKSILNFLSCDIAIDLGTANTLVYVAHQGIVLNEPSVVALAQEGNSFIPYAFGYDAKMMLGRTPADIKTIRPLKDGVIAEFKSAEEMIKHFMSSAQKKKFFIKPRVIVCIPYGSTPVERRAIQDAIESAGAREVYLVYEPMAAAIGAGLPVTEPTGSMIVDIGGGTTEVGIISLGGIVDANSIRVGGDNIDSTIAAYVKRCSNLYIGDSTAEKIKKEIGSAIISKDNSKKVFIKGRDIITGIPKEIKMLEKNITDSILNPVLQITNAVKTVLESAPPEIASDIVETGITITGGGALLKNLDVMINRATGLNVQIASDPLTCVATGAGRILEKFSHFKHVLFQQD